MTFEDDTSVEVKVRRPMERSVYDQLTFTSAPSNLN